MQFRLLRCIFEGSFLRTSLDASEEVFVSHHLRYLKGRKAEEAWLDVEEGVMSVFSEYKSKLDIACDRRRPGIVRAFAFAELVCQPVSLLSVFAAGRAARFRGRLLGAPIGLLVISRYSHTPKDKLKERNMRWQMTFRL